MVGSVVAASHSGSDAPRPDRKVRWGIMGTGAIAADFTRVLSQLPDAEVAALGSRSADRAMEFAREIGIDAGVTTLHSSYDDLVADDSLDIVYVATPSLRHVEDSLRCLEAGRAVLCEKSMAPSAAEAERVLEVARRQQLFFCHGVWSRFFPAMADIRRVIDSGAIGEVRSVHCSFCQADGAGACSATLETGVYCAQFCLWAFGGAAPRVAGVTYALHPESQLDTHVSALLQFPCGGVGTIECSLGHASPREATICGTKGVLRVPSPFWCPTEFSVQTMSGPASQQWSEPQTYRTALPEIAGDFNFVNSQGLAYEAGEITRCLRSGLLEAPAFDSEACLRVMQVITDIRAHWLPPAAVAS